MARTPETRGCLRLAADLLHWLDLPAARSIGLGFGLGGTLWLPSGDSERFVGEGAVRGEPRLMVGWDGPWGLHVAANLGYHLRPRTEAFSFVNDDRLRWSVAARVPLGVASLRALGAAYASHVLVEQDAPEQPGALSELMGSDPVEVLAGLGWAGERGLSVTAAAGTGMGEGIGTPAYRLMVQVGWAPAESSEPPPAPPHPPAPTPPAAAPPQPAASAVTDPDGDRLASEDDLCPNAAEDVDGFEDYDGCPEPDNDQDGVLDDLDDCPLQAETANRYDDDDGCPDVGPDSDGDGVDDVLDRCPLEPELRQGLRDSDGCPEAPPPRAVTLRPGSPHPAPGVSAPALWLLPPLPALVVNQDSDGDGLRDDLEDCPDEAEDLDGFRDGDGCPDPDDDGDGLVDGDDRCPREAETFNGFEDGDGCPDRGPDADQDGVGDVHDVCPLEPERSDGVRDLDGCPEASPELVARFAAADSAAGAPAPARPAPVPEAPPGGATSTVASPAWGADAASATSAAPEALPALLRIGDDDGDGVTNLDDDCPAVREDPDGFQDFDGCPEPDDDGDGLLDGEDRCPRAAETNNGYEDSDGCPDSAPTDIAALAGVVEQVRFRRASAVLRRRGRRVLRRVARLLRARPDLQLEIRGHTDAQGDPDRNRDLSRRRAASAVRWLVEHGIAPERLSSRGYGPDRPVATNDSARGRARNRRVELLYTKQESQR